MLVVAVADVHERPDVIARALAGGVDTVQLRDRAASGSAMLDAAATLRDLTRATSGLLIINDRIDVALACGADGVHLPAAGFPTSRARALAGAAMLIGRSTHALEEARVAVLEGCDYVVLGPIFATPSKAPYGPPLGVGAIERARSSIAASRTATADPQVPVIAIGGIGPAEAALARRSGATGVAVVRALLDAADPESVARALVGALRDTQPST